MENPPAPSPPSRERSSPFLRAAFMVYGVLVYLLSVATFVYTAAFVLDLSIVPSSVARRASSGPARPLNAALVGNAALLTLFAVQHSVMARPAFKAWLTRFVPKPVERSTYCLGTCLALIALMVFWSPIEGSAWQVVTPWLTHGLFGLSIVGFVYVLAASFQLDHFELFGLRQPWHEFTGRPLLAAGFKRPPLYRLSRHPIYLGMLVGMWSAPTMSYGRLVFASLATGYILVGSTLEERDLARTLGEPYRDYQKTVSRLLPLGAFRRRSG